MKRQEIVFVLGIIVVLAVPSAVSAQQTWGSVLGAAAQVAVQQLSPQAQAVVDESKKLAAGASQENFLVTQAKQFLAGGNYQTALDLANYVITTLKSGSVDAKKIMADAQAALTKIAQEKLGQAQQNAPGAAQAGAAKQTAADVGQAVTGVKNLFGAQQ